MRRLTGVLAILVALAAGCGSADPDVDVVSDADHLARLLESTDAVSRYQLVTTVEVYMAENGRVFIDSRGADPTTATYVDSRSSTRLDLGAATGRDGVASMELVNDKSTLFIRIDSSLDIDPRDIRGGGFLWERPGTWMFADIASVLERVDGAEAADVWRAVGAGEGLAVWLDLLRSSGVVTEEDRTELDGEPVTHLAVASSLGALFAAQGMDVDAMLGALTPGVDLGNASTRVDLYVDDADVLRRIEMTMTEENLAGLVDQPLGSFEYLLHTVQDVTRVGDPDLTVELPSRNGARDITDDFGELLAASVSR